MFNTRLDYLICEYMVYCRSRQLRAKTMNSYEQGLRNNFAKRCLMNGMDIYTLSRILGHSSVAVTEQAYLDLTDEDLGKRYQHYSPVGAL